MRIVLISNVSSLLENLSGCLNILKLPLNSNITIISVILKMIDFGHLKVILCSYKNAPCQG